MSKPKLIILEGIDGVGKSTIAENLAKILNLPIEHHGPVKSMQEGKDEYFNFIKNCNYSVIKDRFAMGEETYSIIYRNYKADYMRDLEKALAEKFDVYLFFITARDEQFVIKRLQERGEDFLDLKDFSRIKELAHKYYEGFSLPKRMLFAEDGSFYNTLFILGTITENSQITLGDVPVEKEIKNYDISLQDTIQNLIKRQGGIR